MQSAECKMQRDRLAEVLNVALKKEFDYVPLNSVINIADRLLGEGVIVDVVCCGDCNHGQRDGENGVLCEFGCEEHRPYDHFCAWGERRTFDNEDNEEN